MIETDYSYEIEIGVIGSLIKFFETLHSNLSAIREDDFLTPEVIEIFNTIKVLPPDTDVATILSNIPLNCRRTVMDSLDFVFGEHAFYSQMSRLLQISQSRRLRTELTDIALSAREVSLSEVRLIVENEEPRNNILSAANKSNDNLNHFIENVGRPQKRIMTGFSRLDKTAGGLRIPSVSIIGAYPSTGKTVLALNIIKNQPESVVLFSLEMSSDMIFERMAADVLSIGYDQFSKQKLNEKQVESIKEYAETLRGKIHVFSDIYDIERQSVIISNIKPLLVVVDYIQKVQTAKRCGDRRNEIEYISGQYKQIANYNNCHIILLSQLSRGGASDNRKNNRYGGIPSMSALKESGALEADGDYVMLLHRPYVIDKSQDPKDTALMIDKNKFGGTGLIDLLFFGEFQRFVTVDRGRESLQPEKHYSSNDEDDLNEDLPF